MEMTIDKKLWMPVTSIEHAISFTKIIANVDRFWIGRKEQKEYALFDGKFREVK